MILNAARHQEALRISSMLTESLRRRFRPQTAMVKPEKVIRVLNKVGVRFIVMGTHGINGYRSEFRATHDMDVMVRRNDHDKALAALRKAFPKLMVKEFSVVTRLIDPANEQPIVDLMKPHTPYLQLVFRNCVSVGGDYWIPNLEMALVTKFAAMTSPNRLQDKKLTDGGDFINIVRTNQMAINMKRLEKLANVVYPGGGKEIIQYVEDIKVGRKLRI